MSSALTLQINSLPALKALFGGDGEVEISFRKSAALAFVREELSKGICTHDIERVRDQMIIEMKRNIESALLGTTGYSNDKVLKPKAREILQKAVDDRLKALIQTVVAEHLDKMTEAMIEKKAQERMVWMVDAAIDAAMAKKMPDIAKLAAPFIDAKVNERMQQIAEALKQHD